MSVSWGKPKGESYQKEIRGHTIGLLAQSGWGITQRGQILQRKKKQAQHSESTLK